MKYHHTTETGDICAICHKPILFFWKDADQLNGRSDTTSKVNKKVVHYACIPGAKSLKQINEERKLLK